jgi:hypothetical protein
VGATPCGLGLPPRSSDVGIEPDMQVYQLVMTPELGNVSHPHTREYYGLAGPDTLFNVDVMKKAPKIRGF